MTAAVADKSSASDSLPTYIFKQVIDLLAPFVAELFDRSLAAGHFPGTFKDASITPVLKKQGLNSADASSYRPISNLTVLSKLLERLVVSGPLKGRSVARPYFSGGTGLVSIGIVRWPTQSEAAARSAFEPGSMRWQVASRVRCTGSLCHYDRF